MPTKKRFSGYLTTLVNAYLTHRVEKGIPPPIKDEYVLVITFTRERPAPNYRSAGVELRLRTTEDIADTASWAVIHTTLAPFSYVKHLLNIETKQYAKKGITIDTYVVGTPTEPILDGWKAVWKPQWYADKKKKI